MRLGIIDCGTNTFHLLTAELTGNGQFEITGRERRYVLLGEEGLDILGAASRQRGLDTLLHFRRQMDAMGVSQFRALGTEALRRAANSDEFIREAKALTGILIEVITGDEEARLIHLGVMQAVPPYAGKALIMDVGGGSVEFIIADTTRVYWAESFPVGVQVLYNEFQRNDPISRGDMLAIEAHLDRVLDPLLLQLKRQMTPLLVGASGSFEVIEGILQPPKTSPLYSILTVESYQTLQRRMVPSSLAERLKMPDLPAERAKLIVVAFLLIGYVIRQAGIQHIIPSAYAMKEGVLADMIRALATDRP